MLLYFNLQLKLKGRSPARFVLRAQRLLLISGAMLASLGSCTSNLSNDQTPAEILTPALEQSTNDLSYPTPTAQTISLQELLQESWEAYRQRFIQADGRVIDYEAQDRSISEGQAYAMLRAVLADDPITFDRTLTWSENNLQRQEDRQQTDQLWVWKWGRDETGTWRALDPNFASDADIDAITALILASRRWNQPDYLALAQAKLQDLWELSTVVVGDERYLLPGPAEAFKTQDTIYLNPSYLAPAAFRLFAQVDPDRDWLSLVDSSYQVLEQSATVSALELPSDWIAYDMVNRQFQAVPSSSSLQSDYSFDAYRVWWRVAWDAAWFDSAPAEAYLKQHLQPLQEQWRRQGSIPARINTQGQPTVDYEFIGQYAMLVAALQLIDPAMAAQMQQQKIQPLYQQGFWDGDSAYYTQNLVWLGLFSPSFVPPSLLQSDLSLTDNS